MPEPTAPAWPLPDGVRSQRVNGYDMAWVERGAGRPVVFVHGAGMDQRYFSPQMAPFGERHRAIAVSLRHCWPEPWGGDGEFSVARHVDDLAAFLREVVAEPAHLVGHSRGGTVSLFVAHRAPELVRTLTFAEGGIGMTAFEPQDPALRDLHGQVIETLRARLSRGDVDGALAPFSDYVGGPGSWDRLPRSVKQFFRDNAWTLAAGGHDRLEPFSCADAQAIDRPVLLVRGDASPPQFAAVLERLRPCLRRVECAVVADASHGMSRMNPAGFDAAVLAFIDRH